MCGIAGILSSAGGVSAALESIARRMADAIATRGPDDSGTWADAAAGIALSHRRLSIIDLSPEGHQPMASASGRYVISYNGELYNYRELRAQLNSPWRGTSDTEVLLAAIETWGIEKTLTACNGMFAFALWDRQENNLTLARDRLGEKPLYYGWVGETFAFASELKAFRELEGWPAAINREALGLLMRYSYIPAPHSIYKGVHKLLPAHYLTMKAGDQHVAAKPYWSLEEVVATSIATRFTGSIAEATDQLEAHLQFAVGQRMMSDVPLGAFLSGGIDSSAIVALMQAQSPRPIQTFTIGFSELGFDEAPYAKAVAQHLGTAHHELYISPDAAAEVIHQLPAIYDEPFADASQIPTYLVAKFARAHVTIALSGDGGDELFGGYRRHLRGPAIWRALTTIPQPLRRMAASLLPVHSDKISARSAAEFYRVLCTTNGHPERLVLQGDAAACPTYGDRLNLPFAEWMMLQDSLTYFPGDILTKVDRAAMAVSLETRTPFTDPALIRFAWQLPQAMKIQQGQGKYLLRQMLYRHVPQALLERPKAGFAIPIGQWLRGPLKAWAADLLAPQMLHQQGFLNVAEVQALWQAHQSGRQNFEKPLWNILMWQSWLATQ